jgi:hypothetical protein
VILPPSFDVQSGGDKNAHPNSVVEPKAIFGEEYQKAAPPVVKVQFHLAGVRLARPLRWMPSRWVCDRPHSLLIAPSGFE